MKKLIRITAVVCSAALLLSMSISVFAEKISLQPQKAQYEVDNDDYRAKIDEFYGYIPLDELVVASLNKVVDSYNTFFTPYQHKWFYKHVLLSRPELEISIHESDKDMPEGIPFTADSMGIMAEQGKADSIEEEDGKVRKFNDIDIYWNTLISERKQDEQAVNQFLSESGYNVSAVQDEKDAKKFYLQIDDKITTDEILMIVLELYKKFGFLPKTVTYEKGVYTLYHDLDYIGMETRHTLKAGEYCRSKEIPRLKNNGAFETDVEYHFNPNNKVLLICGKGILYGEDVMKIWNTFYCYRAEKKAEIVIIDKDVILENGEGEYKDYDFDISIQQLTPFFTYRDSNADNKFKNTMQYMVDNYGKEHTTARCIYYLDDNTDSHDVLDGKVKIEKKTSERLILPEQDSISETTENISSSPNTNLGDANLDGTVDLADLTAVAKYNLSSSGFPLKNETAYANADLNGDGIVNSIDLSALIRNQLGKK